MAAAQHQAPFYVVDRSKFTLKSMTLAGTCFDYGAYTDLRLSLLGCHQIQNVQTVLTAVEVLGTRGITVPETALRQGLEAATWPARFEKLSDDPLVVYDGAHNPQGIGALMDSLQTYFPERKVNIISGVMGDKDYGEMVEKLKPVAEMAFVVTPPDNPRSLNANEYAEVFSSHKIPVKAYDDLRQAVCEALEYTRKSGNPLICLGSLYLYKPLSDEIRQALEH